MTRASARAQHARADEAPLGMPFDLRAEEIVFLAQEQGEANEGQCHSCPRAPDVERQRDGQIVALPEPMSHGRAHTGETEMTEKTPNQFSPASRHARSSADGLRDRA
jgi:hypothetical protein